MPKQPAIDYSINIGGMENPVSPNYGLLADAALIEGKQAASDITFAGTAAVEGYKGYQRAELSKQIDETLANTVAGDYQGRNAKEASVSFDNAVKQRTAGIGAGDENLIGEAETEMRRIKEAADQNLIGRQEAITRIGAAVKKFSVATPGMAQEFRQMGADFTGISRIDILGVHKGLTEQGAAEKAAAKMQEMQLAYVQDISKKYGIPPDKVDANHIRAYQQSKSLEASHENQKKKFEMQSMDSQTGGLAVRQLATSFITRPIANVNLQIGALAEANNFQDVFDSKGNIDRSKLSTQQGAYDKIFYSLSGSIEKERYAALSEFDASVNAAIVKGAPLDSKDVSEARKNINEKFDQFKQSVSTIEGFSTYKKVLDRSKGDVALMQDEFYRKYPLISEMGKNQQVWNSYLANPALFVKTNPVVGSQMRSIENDLIKQGQLAQGYKNINQGNVPSVSDNTSTDIAVRVVKFEEAKKRLEKLATASNGDLSQEDVEEHANWIRHLNNELNPTDPRQMDYFNKLVVSDTYKKAAAHMTEEQAIRVFEPLYTKLQYSLFGENSQVKVLEREVNKFNEFALAKSVPIKAVIKPTVNQDGGAFSVVYETVATKEPKPIGQGGLLATPNTAAYQPNIDAMKLQIASVNKTIDTAVYSVSNLSKVVGQHAPVFDVRKDLQNKFVDPAAPTTFYKKEPKTVSTNTTSVDMKVSKETQTSRDQEAMAIRAKESSPKELKEDIAKLKVALKEESKTMSGTIRDILKGELKYMEGALAIHENK